MLSAKAKRRWAFFNSLSIRLKLITIIFGMSALALVISVTLDGIVNWRAQRAMLMQRLQITADVISLQSKAALEFMDPEAARENLLSLSPDPDIRKACLYDEQNNVFATYTSSRLEPGPFVCPEVQETGSNYEWEMLQAFHTIQVVGHKLGSIYLEYDLRTTYLRFMEETLLKLAIISLVLALVWPISSYLQRIISRPIVQLAAITRRFSKEREELVYAQKLGDDEIGELVDAFNLMMKEIHSNEQQLGNAITEAELARKKAEDANRSKSEFLANMSHEIRTPMNAVTGLTHLLSLTTPLTDRQREFLKVLQTSADSLLSLINDLLDFAKLEEGSVQFEQVEFDLVELVQKVQSMIRLRAEEKHLKLLFDASNLTQRNFIGDPLRVQQILTNLISNAIKFTESGYVKVSVSNGPRTSDGRSDVSLRVSDSGIGIPEEKLVTIFDKFTQADASTTRKYGGTGLGLAICKALADYMGGSIQVSSQPGKGSAFTVLLPLRLSGSAAEEVSIAPIVESVAPPVQRKRILLVEDYAPNVLVAATMLSDFGYTCDVAQNGTEAVHKFATYYYALILMDIQMPGMDGMETARRIRAMEHEKGGERTPIIAMTAFAMSGDREKCLKAGMDDYLSKPFQPEELRQKIAIWVEPQKEAAAI